MATSASLATFIHDARAAKPVIRGNCVSLMSIPDYLRRNLASWWCCTLSASFACRDRWPINRRENMQASPRKLASAGHTWRRQPSARIALSGDGVRAAALPASDSCIKARAAKTARRAKKSLQAGRQADANHPASADAQRAMAARRRVARRPRRLTFFVPARARASKLLKPGAGRGWAFVGVNVARSSCRGRRVVQMSSGRSISRRAP